MTRWGSTSREEDQRAYPATVATRLPLSCARPANTATALQITEARLSFGSAVHEEIKKYARQLTSSPCNRIR